MKVKLLHPVRLTLIKDGCEYPELFDRGDVVEVDEWTETYLRGIGYIA